MEPKTLARSFNKDGFQFRQIKRTDHAALYEKEKNGSTSYEVVRPKINKRDHSFPPYTTKDGTEHPGQTVPAGSESYPSSEDWGTYGFSYPSRTSAEAKLRSLSETQDHLEPH